MKKTIKILSKNWIAIIMGMVVTLFALFIMGYILNGFYDYKFDINACWGGLTVIGSGIITGLGNHFINSKYNSDLGKPPVDEVN